MKTEKREKKMRRESPPEAMSMKSNRPVFSSFNLCASAALR